MLFITKVLNFVISKHGGIGTMNEVIRGLIKNDVWEVIFIVINPLELCSFVTSINCFQNVYQTISIISSCCNMCY
jgi:hypothetical protein